MFWRLPPSDYEAAFRQRSLENRSLAPRSELVRLEHSPQLRPDHAGDDEGTWSIPCLYVARAGWRTGVGTALLAAAIDRAIAHGATRIEGYPVKAPSVDPYTGYDTMFGRAGFHLIRPGRGRGRALWRKDV